MKKFLTICALLFGAALASGQQNTFPATGTANEYSNTNLFDLGIDLGPKTFSTLGAPGNGRMLYCTDCQATNPCASGGTGAVARREAAAWNCGGGSGGGSSNATSIQSIGVDGTAPTTTNQTLLYNSGSGHYVVGGPVELSANKDQPSGYLGIDSSGNSVIENNLSVLGIGLFAGTFDIYSVAPGLAVSCTGSSNTDLILDSDHYLKECPNGAGPFPLAYLPNTAITANTLVKVTSTLNELIASSLIDNGTTLTIGDAAISITSTGSPAVAQIGVVGTNASLKLQPNGTGTVNLTGNLKLTGATPAITSSAADQSIAIIPNGIGGIEFPQGSNDCTSPALWFQTGTTTGLTLNTPAVFGLCSGGTEMAAVNGSGILIPNISVLQFTNNGLISGTVNLGLSWETGGLLAIGTSSTPGDETGIYRSANAKKLIVDYTNATTTASVIWSWATPLATQWWSFDCEFGYYTSDATNGNLILGVGFGANAPTTSEINAIIYNKVDGSAGSFKTNGKIITSSGNTPVLTGNAPAATGSTNLYVARMFGGFQSNVLGNTFSLTAAVGTSGTITIPAGNFCAIH